jgi:hypothetical protein
MIILPGFYEQAPESLKMLLDSDPHVRAYVSSHHSEMMEKGEVDRSSLGMKGDADSETAAGNESDNDVEFAA